MNMQVCRFQNAAGLMLKGIAIMPGPEITRHDTAALYLPGLVLGSTAVHRLGMEIGKFLVAKGYPTFLFDQSGIGESEGELPAGSHADMVGHVISGAMVPDTLEILDFIKGKFDVRAVLLIGHCGGGLTASYIVNGAPLVRGVFLISTPISGQEVIGHNEGAMREYETIYKSKLFSWGAWKKFFTGRSDYALLGRVIKHRFGRRPAQDGKDIRINQRLFEGLMKARKDKKIFMLMGERDPGIDEFRVFCDRYLDKEKECVILKDASHGFVTRESMDALFHVLGRFIEDLDRP